MEQLQISLADVSNTAQRIRHINQDLDQTLQQMRQIMNQLAASWQSPAAETIRTKFNGMTPIFQNYKDIVDSYAKFLDATVVSYETIENSMQQNASSFQ